MLPAVRAVFLYSIFLEVLAAARLRPPPRPRPGTIRQLPQPLLSADLPAGISIPH
jgi:hypothetical protein